MRRRNVWAAFVLSVALGLGGAAASAGPASAAPHARPAIASCTPRSATDASCPLIFARPAAGPGAASEGFGPADIESAYGLSGGSSATVAVVAAYGYPALAADLATYRSTWHLPTCTTADGCLRVVDQNGGSSLPGEDDGWALEQALDVDAVSAACPSCHITVVEATTPAGSDLGQAVNTAATMGAVVSASWTMDEGPWTPDDITAYYTHPGVPIVAATGDAGYTAASEPAVAPSVIAVGGTSLSRNPSYATARARLSSDERGVTAAQAALASAKRSLTSAVHAVGADTHTLTLHLSTTKRAAMHRTLASALRTLSSRQQAVSADERTVTTRRAAVAADTRTVARTRPWRETAWSGAGSGCSTRVARPSWQPATCTGRSVADVAADADPDTGLLVRATESGSAAWYLMGGTSLATPLVAAMIARSGHAGHYSDAAPLYLHASSFNDVTAGSNGSCSGGAVCTARSGYDGVTGVGTPKSLASF